EAVRAFRRQPQSRTEAAPLALASDAPAGRTRGRAHAGGKPRQHALARRSSLICAHVRIVGPPQVGTGETEEGRRYRFGVVERAGGADGVRQRNLSTVLRMIHLQGPQSRSQLTAITGLNRSTVAALAGELVELGLAQERAPAETNRVGRPSPVVSADPGVTAVAVNPEVGDVTIAAVGMGGRVQVRERVERDAVITPEATAEL